MPKFQRPNLPNLENAPEAAGLGALGNAISTIPQLYAKYKLERKQQDNDMNKLSLDEAEFKLKLEKAKGEQTSMTPNAQGQMELTKYPGVDPRMSYERGAGLNVPTDVTLPQSAPKVPQSYQNSSLFRAHAQTKDGRPIAANRQGQLMVNGEEVYSYEKHGEPQPLVNPTLEKGDVDDLVNLKTSIDQLNEVKGLFSPDFSGPVQARIGQFSRLTGIDIPELKSLSPDNTAFKTAVQTAINDYVKAVTGAQMSEPEAKRILKALPDINQADEAFMPALNEAVTIASRKLDTRLNVLETVGRRNVGELRNVMSNSSPSAPQTPSAAEVTSKAQYDSLPSGAMYMSNGKQFRKK